MDELHLCGGHLSEAGAVAAFRPLTPPSPREMATCSRWGVRVGWCFSGGSRRRMLKWI